MDLPKLSFAFASLTSTGLDILKTKVPSCKQICSWNAKHVFFFKISSSYLIINAIDQTSKRTSPHIPHWRKKFRHLHLQTFAATVVGIHSCQVSKSWTCSLRLTMFTKIIPSCWPQNTPKKKHVLRCPSRSKAPWEISKKNLKVLEFLEVIMQTITMYMAKGVEQTSLPSMFSRI